MCECCGAWSAPGAVSACCTWHMRYVLWCLKCTRCCQCLLHLAYVLAICGACSEPGAVSTCCTWHMRYVLWCLKRTRCCQCLLHLAYVLAMCECCGACSALGAVSACFTLHMCWLYVVLVANLMLSVHLAYVLAICGVWSAPMYGYMYCRVLGEHLVQVGSGPCKIPNFSHLLRSYGTYIYFVGHVRIDLRQS